MTKTTVGNLNDRQANVADLRQILSSLEDDLINAESCETPADFDANMASFIEGAKQLFKEATGMLSE